MGKNNIDFEQRRALRKWFFSQSPKPSQRAAITWFADTYNRHLTQSAISDSLSKRFAYLDHDNYKVEATKSKAQWPVLEAALWDYLNNIEILGGPITQDLIVDKATILWGELPEYQNLQVPAFSNGWIDRFKKRHALHKITLHGEASSVPEKAHEDMKLIRTLCGDYEEKDIYNMDETGLFWKQSPSSGLSTQSRARRKLHKDRITLVFCTNYDGSHKLPLWIIGHSKEPRSLKQVNLQAMGCYYRANGTAWMNHVVMAEWLKFFYSTIAADRKILLLMDNFSAHITGLEIAPAPANIRIQWLPANSTSIYQPLDQGIVNNTKFYYKKQLLKFLIRCYERQIDPYKVINLYDSIDWITRSWFSEVKESTIYKCFRKAKILPSTETINLPVEPLQDLSPLYRDVQQLGNISDAMELSNFLYPEDETPTQYLNDMGQPSIDGILSRHTFTMTEKNDDDLEEEEEIITSVIPSLAEALQSIDVLLLHMTHSNLSTPKEISLLRQLKLSKESELANSRIQMTLDSWIRQ